MTQKRYTNLSDLGKDLGIAPERVAISKMKTKLKKRIIQEVKDKNLTAAQLSDISGLSRTVISGILNGSLQSVSLERLLRLAAGVNLTVELQIKNAA